MRKRIDVDGLTYSEFMGGDFAVCDSWGKISDGEILLTRFEFGRSFMRPHQVRDLRDHLTKMLEKLEQSDES